MDKNTLTVQREVKIDKIIFKVTSVFCGSKDLEQTIKSWAYEKTLTQMKTA